MLVIEDPVITKIDNYRFQIQWASIPGFALNMDFEPLVAQVPPDVVSKGFSLLHWQAKPKRSPNLPGRQWGCWFGGNYYTARQIQDIRGAFCMSLDLDESENATVPTSVLCFQGLRPYYTGSKERKLALANIR